MVSFPNCKINLGLHIIGKRTDGFHNIETVFFPIGLTDALEFIITARSAKEVTLSQSGLTIPGNDTENLCIKAYQLLKKDFPELPHLKMHLHKSIPMGAGLGGGSSNAAFLLKMLNSAFDLNIPEIRLMEYALSLGSDCPFFIKNKICFAHQRGEELEEFSLDLSDYKILLVYPHIHINTGWAFSQIIIEKKKAPLKDILKLPVTSWQGILTNDFELPVFDAHPEIRDIKQTLLNAGAIYASLSGSGSTVFGLFNKNYNPTLNFPVHYFLKWV